MRKTLQMIFVLWGVISLGAALVLLAVTAISFNKTAIARTDFAGPSDVLFILRAGKIPLDQKLVVLKSFQSGTAMNGDHLEAFSVELEKFHGQAGNPKSLEADGWSQTEPDGLWLQSLELALSQSRKNNLSWMPTREQMTAEQTLYKFYKLEIIEQKVVSAQIMAYQPKGKILLFWRFKV